MRNLSLRKLSGVKLCTLFGVPPDEDELRKPVATAGPRNIVLQRSYLSKSMASSIVAKPLVYNFRMRRHSSVISIRLVARPHSARAVSEALLRMVEIRE